MVETTQLLIGYHRTLQRPPEGVTEINVVRGGPEQLLAWIETQLGLTFLEESWTTRVVQYHGKLARGTGTPYSASLEADAWATSSELLHRRDELLLAGWNPKEVTGHALVDSLAKLEPFTGAPGLPDRLRRVISAFEVGMVLPPHDVLLDESTESWPHLWRDVLGRMTTQVAATPAPAGTGTLRMVQENLLHGTAKQAPVDDSLLVLRTSSRHAAAQFVATWKPDDNVTIYCPDRAMAPLLDAELQAHGIPTMGAGHESRGQPAHQVLPLCMRLLWQPVNPYALLDLLLLPVGPLRGVRKFLAPALEKQPGFESEAWMQAMDHIAQDDEDGKKRDRVNRWLNHPRYEFGELIPTSVVDERCKIVAQWAAGYAQLENAKDSADDALVAALLSAASQASALGTLASQMASKISEAQLDRLLEEVRQEANMEIPCPAESGGPVLVHNLADVQATKNLVWLGTQAHPSASPRWTIAEIDQLASAGVDLSTQERNRALALGQTRGILQAQRMVVIEMDAPESNTNPLWLRLRADLVIDGKPNGPTPLLERMLGTAESPVQSRKVAQAQGPVTRVHWVANHAVPVPDSTSATALEAQLACPLKWTLRHAMHIRPSRTANIPADQTLKGNFAHELLARVFTPGDPPTPEVAQQRMGEAFDHWLPRNAAPLASPRKLGERNSLRQCLLAASRQFAKALLEGEYKVLGLEVEIKDGTTVDGAHLKGSIDCVAQASDGSEAIVDFKLGGHTRFQEKLEQGRALQLATYAHARPAPVAAGAYFVLLRNRIISPAGGSLAGATHVVQGPSMQETWQRFESALHSASDWLGSGKVAARPMQDPNEWARGTALAVDPENPEDACKYCDYDALCGRRLLA